MHTSLLNLSPPGDRDDDLAQPLVPFRRAVRDDEMDITPMIDMTFLLLIYFLVATVPDIRTTIELPAARHGGAVSQRDATIITLGESSSERAPIYLADGKVPEALVSGEPASERERIAEHVRRGVQADRLDVVIKADRRVPHRDVARVMQAASLVEGIRLHLAVLEQREDQ